MARLSQMEGELTRERTKADLATARAVGRVGGRKRRMTDSKIEAAKKLLISGLPQGCIQNPGSIDSNSLSLDS